MSEEIKVITKKLNKKLVFAAIAVIAVVLIAVLATVASKSANANKLEEQLSLGDKYLSELNYEQAIASYLAVIEIDPKNANAYLKLADAYAAQGEYNKAISILEDALTDVTGDVTAAVNRKLEEIKALKAKAEAIPTPMPTVEPKATSTPVPTATSTPTPTATSTPTPEPTNTPTPEITVTSANMLKYVINDENEIVITGLKDKTVEEIVIPKEIEGRKVVEIGNSAFSGMDFKKVILHEGITRIGNHAFNNCIFMTEFYIPEAVKYIGDYAFFNCWRWRGELIIPNSVTYLGESAFSGCSNIERIYISENITSIAFDTFGNCKSLTSIKIPKNVTSIGDGAFLFCENLEYIEIPASVTHIGDSGFFTGIENAFYGSDNVIFVTPSGSYAEQYAIENNIPVETY